MLPQEIVKLVLFIYTCVVCSFGQRTDYIICLAVSKIKLKSTAITILYLSNFEMIKA